MRDWQSFRGQGSAGRCTARLRGARFAAFPWGVLSGAFGVSVPSCRRRSAAFTLLLCAVVMAFACAFTPLALAQTIQFGAATYTATELGTGASVVIEMSDFPSSSVTINLTATSSPGTENSDYRLSQSGLIFDATTKSRTITVTAVDDPDEDDESVVVGFETPLPSGVTAGTQSTTTVTLVDNDRIEFSIDSANATEGSDIVFTVSLSGTRTGDLEVDYATSTETDDTATSGTDFTAVSATTLTFSSTESSKSITISTTNDSVDEPNETFTVTLSNASDGSTISSTAGSGTGTINDNDPPELRINDANANEGDGVVFTVSLSSADGTNDVTVSYAASTSQSGETAESGDLSGTMSGTLTFEDGDTTAKSITIDTTEDAVDEDDETFTVTLSNASTNATISDSTGQGTINDDDTATLSINDANATEGGSMTFTVTLSLESEATVTVDYETSIESDNTATSGTDFTAVSATTLSFTSGLTTRTFTVATSEDTTDEHNETFTVTLSNSSGPTISDATGEGTINDDDDPPTVSIGDAGAVTEGTSATFEVELSTASGKEVTVAYAASTSESDETAESGDLSGTTSGSLTFTAGQTSKSVSIATNDDSTDEDDGETFSVSLTGATNATVSTTTAKGSGSINDNDSPPTLSINDASGDEGENVVFTVTVTPPSEKAVSVTYTTSLAGSGDKAEAGDFTAVSSAATLSLNSMQASGSITISTTEDTTDEENETFTVTLSGPSNATLSDSSGQGTITDDDNPPTVSVANATAEEGGDVEFTVTLSERSEKTGTVTYTASTSGTNTAKPSDLSGTLTRTLTFSAGDTSETFTIGTNEDNIDERPETFSVALSGASNLTVSSSAGTATGTINDNDATPTVSLSLSMSGSIGENSTGNVAVTASLNHPSTDPTTVTVSAAAVSPAEADDFTLTGSTLTIGAEATASTGTVTIAPVDNETDAPNKTVTVSGTARNDLAVTAPDSKTLTITDDDPEPVVTLVLTPPSIHEVSTAGQHVSTVTATQDRPSSEATTVTVSATAMSPAVAEDFTLSTNKVLTIAAGSKASIGTVTVTGVDNNVDAPDKRVTVSATATNMQGVSGDLDDETLSVMDDEPAPKVTLVLTEDSIRESDDTDVTGDQHVTTVTATLNHPSSNVTTVTLTPAASDFTLSASGVLTIEALATESSGSVTLTAVDNDTDAPDKALTLNASAVNMQGIMQPDGIALAIEDDEPPPTVTLELTSDSILETAAATMVSAKLSHPSSNETAITVSAAAVPSLPTSLRQRLPLELVEGG